ncbi:MAG: hypothetical protein OXE40_18100, partial [Gammaproteobacteria bacterium]|nr:hypothetical protein [Gammaproteobacteria bacterium]
SVRSGIEKPLPPLYWHPPPEAGGAPDPSEGGSVPADVILNGKDSDFSTRFVVDFDPESHAPAIGVPEIRYRLTPGPPKPPYFIPRADLGYWTQAAEAQAQGQHRENESASPADRSGDVHDHPEPIYDQLQRR